MLARKVVIRTMMVMPALRRTVNMAASRTINLILFSWVLHIHRITSVQPLIIRESTRLDRTCAVGHHFPAWLISTLRLGPNIVFALSSLHLSLHPTSIINPLFPQGDPTPPGLTTLNPPLQVALSRVSVYTHRSTRAASLFVQILLLPR